MAILIGFLHGSRDIPYQVCGRCGIELRCRPPVSGDILRTALTGALRRVDNWSASDQTLLSRTIQYRGSRRTAFRRIVPDVDRRRNDTRHIECSRSETAMP